MAYKLITLPCISLMFIEMKFIHCHSCVIFVTKFMSIFKDYVNYNRVITSLKTYILNIPICGTFEKDIELSKK